jgi:hypothetical protein
MSAKRSSKAQGLEGKAVAKPEEGKRRLGEVGSTKTAAKPAEDERDQRLGLTPELKRELRAWLRVEMRDPNFKPEDPVRVNHALLLFIAQVAAVLNLPPQKVEQLTGLKRQHQLKLQPHAVMEEDVHLALFYALKWCNGTHLNPLKVLDWVMHHPASLFVVLDGYGAGMMSRMLFTL